MFGRLRALWARFALAFALTSLSAAAAPAADPGVAVAPRDVPMVLQPRTVTIPALPDTDQVRDLGWLRVAYPPSAHERVEPLLASADLIKAELADELGQPVLTRPIEVRIARSPEDMTALAPVDVPPPAYASAVALAPLRLVLLSMRAPVSNEGTDLEELLRHELAHIALDDAVVEQHVPRWFNEGFAVHASGERPWERNEALAQATVMKTLVPLSELDQFPDRGAEVDVAYAESADFVRFLLRQSDRARFASLIDRTRKGEAFERALGDAYSSDLRKLEFQWREQLAQRFTFWPVLLSGSVVWMLVLFAMAFGWFKKKKREKVIYAKWDREDELEAARRAALARSIPPEAPLDAPLRPSVPSVPKIEHEGDWHTLH